MDLDDEAPPGLGDPDPTPVQLGRSWYTRLSAADRAAVIHWLGRHGYAADANTAGTRLRVVANLTLHADHVDVAVRVPGTSSTVHERIDETHPLTRILGGQLGATPTGPVIDFGRLLYLLEMAAEHVPDDCEHFPAIQAALQGDPHQ